MTKTHLIQAAISAIIFLSACSEQAPPPASKEEPKPLAIETFTVQPGEWQLSFDSYGHLESTEEVQIGVEFSDTVKQVLFQEGQTIRAGQVLIRLDDRKEVLRLQRAEAALESAIAEQEKVAGTYERHKNLASTGALSSEQLKQSEAADERAAAAVRDARASVSLVEQELRENTIISPVDGLIVKRNAEPGQTVLPGDVLLVVQVTDTLRMVTHISEKEVSQFKVGDISMLRSPAIPDREYPARVEVIGSSADPRTGNFVVKLTINNSDRMLRAGMSARVTLKGITHPGTLLIPKKAIVDRNRRKVIYKVIDGKVKEVEPILGVAGNDEWVPAQVGVSAGDQLAVSQLDLLVDGRPVQAAAPEPVEEKKQSEEPKKVEEPKPVDAPKNDSEGQP